MWLISPCKSIDEVTSGSFSAVSHVICFLSILLINAVTTIQRQVARVDGKVSQLTDLGGGGEVVFLSFSMHWPV